PDARTTVSPFLTLAVVIGTGVVADRIGVFERLARWLMPDRASPPAAAAAMLTFTAVVSALSNLDVAAVVAMPVALRAARRSSLGVRWLPSAVAVTANAASFLLPTSNVTNLLILGRAPLPTIDYLRRSWLPWLVVTAMTVGALTVLLARDRARHPTRDVPVRGLHLDMLIDLLPMFVGAAAIRALPGPRLVPRGG